MAKRKEKSESLAQRLALMCLEDGNKARILELRVALAGLIADCYASGHDDMLSMSDARDTLERSRRWV